MSSNQALPLILISGHMGTVLDWRFQIAAFASDREIIVPDQHYKLTSIKDMAGDIAPRLPARFDLAGWSMGGYISLELYPLIKDRVRNMALIHTSARAETAAAKDRRSALIRSIEVDGMPAVFARDVGSHLVDPACISDAFKGELVAEKLRLGRQALMNQIEALSGRADTRSLLPHIQCKTLVVAGQADTIAPVEHSQEMASLLPNCTLRIFDDVGHCSPWEKTSAFNLLLKEFLE